ncbi:MAG: hypothetical protein V1784_08205, partial [bacterium]
ERLKFLSNPLDCRPNADLVGLDEQEARLKDFIMREEICFLNGLTGSGKSSLLLRIQRHLKGHKFLYLDAQTLPKGFNLEEAIRSKRSFFDQIRLKKMPTKTPVLIIDEFQATDPGLVLDARGRWEANDDRQIKSIVIAQIDPHLKNVTPSFLERIGSRIIETRILDNDEMKEILRRRLHNKRTRTKYYDRLSDEAVNLLVDCADGNPRRLLEYAGEIFDFHHRKFSAHNPIEVKPDYTVTYWGAKEILELAKVDVASYEEKRKTRALVASGKAGSFKQMFSEDEQQLLKYLMTGPKSLPEIMVYFHLTENAARQRLTTLEKKHSVVVAGERGQNKLWRAAGHVKRMTVRV